MRQSEKDRLHWIAVEAMPRELSKAAGQFLGFIIVICLASYGAWHLVVR